jgi:hypothetical protein
MQARRFAPTASDRVDTAGDEQPPGLFEADVASPLAAVCASSPATINSGSGGTQPICHNSLPPPIHSTTAGARSNDKHSSPPAW